jgi:hypothetical protein
MVDIEEQKELALKIVEKIKEYYKKGFHYCYIPYFCIINLTAYDMYFTGYIKNPSCEVVVGIYKDKSIDEIYVYYGDKLVLKSVREPIFKTVETTEKRFLRKPVTIKSTEVTGWEDLKIVEFHNGNWTKYLLDLDALNENYLQEKFKPLECNE